MTWKLQTVTGEFTGKEVSIERDMLVGRHQDADLLIQSADISRRHAAFLLKDNALWVQDLKSSNGTFVNDLRIENETLLKQGDIVQFAAHKFSVLEPAVPLSAAKSIVAEPVQSNVNDEKTQAVTLAAEPDIQSNAQLDEQKDSLVEPVKVADEVIQQPAEAIATSESAQSQSVSLETAPEKTPSQTMVDQGILDLKERDASVSLDRDGMPQGIGIPKPAPLPEGVDLSNVTPVVKDSVNFDVPEHCSTKEEETQKNASVGLMALIVLIVVALLAWYLLN
ncbi:FHA domain-containing protein [Acinetobacter sp. KS-LM10]|uniref:FHA domain-containing protein n=1 Tax=Acinetobacter sp. KS-LM10 TaxID=3120518 RepID=UPI0030D59677